MPTLTLSDRPAPEIRADALVLFARPSADSPGGDAPVGQPATTRLCHVAELPARTIEHIESGLRALRARGRADEVSLLTNVPGLACELVAVSGLGGPDEVTAMAAESIRRAAGAVARSLGGRSSVIVLPPAADTSTLDALAEGLLLGAYTFTHHRGTSSPGASGGEGGRDGTAGKRRRLRRRPADEVGAAADPALSQITLCLPKTRGTRSGPTSQDYREALHRAEILGRYQGWARDLVNTSPSELSPQGFVEAVSARLPKSVQLNVLDEDGLRTQRCAGLLGVGLGSTHPPRLVTVSYQPRRPRTTLAFVGKGITFDSGGLCLKPAGSMITMKCDMAGAAAVVGGIFALAELQVPVAVTGYLCLAENMPSGTAQRPGDVLTMRDGQTVEVINTDAEGRLVLADGLCLASESNPDAIVDVATLTGAAVTALGRRTAAVLANDDDFQAEVTSAATAAGETVWPMPIAEEIRADLASPVADLKHTGDTVGGCMVGAAFLREFVGTLPNQEPIPWAHIDIAGSAYNDTKPYGYTPKGGTGFGVRTLVGLAEARALSG